MPDKFTVTTTTSYGSRLLNSLKGVIFGIILFFGSIFLLYWNEGRIDLSIIAKTAIEIDSKNINTDTTLEGKLISTTGTVTTEETLGDNLFLIPDKFIAVERVVEMFAWVEKSESTSKTNVGGSETTETTYTYNKEWIENVPNSSQFKYPEDHQNPTKSLESLINRVMNSKLGFYKYNPQTITLPDFSQLSINNKNILLSGSATIANDKYIYIPIATTNKFENPQLGDLRISYNVLKPDFTGTIFAKLTKDELTPYFDKEGNKLYRLFSGTRDEGISTLHTEYTTLLWILRVVGFLMMWFGFTALFEPISVLLDFLPIFGTLSRTVTSIITFIVALILSLVVIMVSMLLHSVVFLVIAVIGTLFLVFYSLNKLRKNKLKA